MLPDQAKLDEFVGKILNYMGAAATGAMVLIGANWVCTKRSPKGAALLRRIRRAE